MTDYQLTDRQRAVLQALVRGGSCSRKALARMTGTTPGHVERTAESLHRQLLVQRTSTGGAYVWSITDAGRRALLPPS